jgi:hypothetical protein
MGIAADFFAKHIRPLGLEAVAMVCENNPSLTTYLEQTLRMTEAEVSQLYNGWAQAAMLAPTAANLQSFVAVANAIALARWGEHGQTAASTVLFTQSATITELSQWGAQFPNQTSDVMLTNPVPIAVTIFANGRTPQVDYNVDTLPNVVVRGGLCVHMDPL